MCETLIRLNNLKADQMKTLFFVLFGLIIVSCSRSVSRVNPEQQDFASSNTASKWGMEQGANLMLFGEMTSETDTYNNKRVVNYVTTLFLTDIETNKRVWYGQEEIKKYIKN